MEQHQNKEPTDRKIDNLKMQIQSYAGFIQNLFSTKSQHKLQLHSNLNSTSTHYDCDQKKNKEKITS